MNKRSVKAVFGAAALAVAALAASPGFADKPGEVRAYAENQLASNYAAREIGKNCPTIRAVESKIGGAAMRMKKTLSSKGYSKAEINAGLKGIKLNGGKAAGQKMVQKMGAKPGDAASYCAVGEKEIAQNTFIGSVLKKK